MKKLLFLCLLALNVSAFGNNAYTAGVQAYDSRDYQNAINAFQNAINMDNNLYKAYYMLGLTYILNNNPQLGEQTLLQTVSLFPMEWKTYVLLAEYYTTEKNYDNAVIFYDKALELYTIPQHEASKYQKKLDDVKALQRNTWIVSEAEKKAILSHISVPIDMNTWRAALVEKRNNDTHIAYALKTQDYMGGKWTQALDISCTQSLELNNFNAINEWLASHYRQMNASLDTISEDSTSRLFEIIVQKPKTHIIGQIFPVNGGYCIAQYMQKKIMKDADRSLWIEDIKKIKMH